MRDCDNCGDLPATVPLGGLLHYCAPCAEVTCIEFAVDLGYVTREEGETQLAEWATRREAMAEEAA